MRYLDIIFMILMINLTLALFTQTNMIPSATAYQNFTSTEIVDAEGNMQETNQSLGYKLKYWANRDDDVQNYLRGGVQNSNNVYLQSGGDFLKGLNLFVDLYIKGTVLVEPTLRNFGVPAPVTWYFAVPVYFLYGLALITMISGRSTRY
jgi:hypothetical protein